MKKLTRANKTLAKKYVAWLFGIEVSRVLMYFENPGTIRFTISDSRVSRTLMNWARTEVKKRLGEFAEETLTFPKGSAQYRWDVTEKRNVLVYGLSGCTLHVTLTDWEVV